MAIKGKTKIELMNAEGEVVKTVEDENMITNALSNMLSTKWNKIGSYSNLFSTILPIATNAFGGILLWDEILPEDTEIRYPVAGVLSLGNAGSPNTDTNPFRGDYNQEESGQITNGYRHVFDFATDKGNGVIKSVSLTDKKMGDSGMKVYRPNVSIPTSAIVNATSHFNGVYAYNCVILNFFYENGKLYAVMAIASSNNNLSDGTNKYSVYELEDVDKVSLFAEFGSSGFVKYLAKKTPVSNFVANSAVSYTTTPSFKTENEICVYYNKSTKSGVFLKNNLSSHETKTFPYVTNDDICGIADNKIFVDNKGTIDIYDMTTQTKIKSCNYHGETKLTQITSHNSFVKKISENIYAQFYANTIVYMDLLKELYFVESVNTINQVYGSYVFDEFIGETSTTIGGSRIMSINNLPEAVTKTAELTMKITYDLLQV